MSLIPQIADGQLCERCRLHAATVVASESVMDWAHGLLRMWCECCYLDDEIKKTEKAMERYAELYRQLQSACTDEPPRDPQALVRDNEKFRLEAERQWIAAHCMICGQHYPGVHAMNYAAPHPEGEHCYWPRPDLSG